MLPPIARGGHPFGCSAAGQRARGSPPHSLRSCRHPVALGPIAPEVGGIDPLPGTAVADQTPTQEHHVE